MNSRSDSHLEGNSAFTMQVPFSLLERGDKQRKPLIIYLHGYKQNADYFEKKVPQMLALEAHHLFLQGPYPVYDEKHSRPVEQWGRAWYLYDGRREQFAQSLEKSSAFIQSVVDQIKGRIKISRLAVLGYSMGGYLAGYFGLSRPNYVDDLIVIGGRIKTEHFEGRSYSKLNVLALHGKDDSSVAAESQQESCRELQKMGADVSFKMLNERHQLNNNYIDEAVDWLVNKEYDKFK